MANGGTGKPLTKHLNCPICKKKFSKVANLKGHILLHKGKRQLKCNKCPKSFLDINELMSHKKTHKTDVTNHQGEEIYDIVHLTDKVLWFVCHVPGFKHIATLQH